MLSRAYCRWVPPKELEELLRDAERRAVDLSPAMAQCSEIGFQEVAGRLTSSSSVEYPWPARAPETDRRDRYRGHGSLGVGEHGGFLSWLRRDFTARNMVVFDTAPHAHLFDMGTNWYAIGGERVHVWNENRRHISRPQSRQRIAQAASGKRQPERPFVYFSDAAQARFGTILLDYVLPTEAMRAA